MGVDNVYFISLCKSGNFLCTKNSKRIADRGKEDIFLWQKCEALLPFARWPDNNENLMSQRLQPAA